MVSQRWSVDRIGRALSQRSIGETLKGLRKRGIKQVKVITQADFAALIEQAQVTRVEAGPGRDNSQKRIELQLIEIERLRREKSGIDHQRGLLETERNALQGKLDQIANAGSRALGEKLTADDVRRILQENEELAAELASEKRACEIARASFEEEIARLRVEMEALRLKESEARRELAERDRACGRIKDDLEASRNLAADHARKNLEWEQEVEGLKAAVEARDQEIEQLKKPPERESGSRFGLRSAATTRAEPRRASDSGGRPLTRRLQRTTRYGRRKSGPVDMGFGAGQPRTSRAGRRRKG